MRSSSILSLAASISSAAATYKGFNYGSTDVAGAAFTQTDFENLFTTAAGLVGTSGFSSARLYTMIQGATTDTVISAIPAAIATNTYILLGMWCSAGQADFDDEITALKDAISQYGDDLAPLLVGISVGSEDLYRDSETGIIAGNTDPGASPDTLVSYITQVRDAISGTALSGASIGHVDTWTSWVNGSNDAVINAVDWLGVDAYPYFQNTEYNPISVGAELFEEALANTTDAADGKPVWVTETGWPVSGSTENDAVASIANAKTYWDQVGCDLLFGKYNTWWYTLQDYGSSPSFGVVGETLSTTPLYDLSCSASSSSSSSSASSTKASTKSVASATSASASSGAATATSAVETPVPSAGDNTVTSSAAAASTTAAGSSAAASTTVSPVTEAASTTVSAVTTGSSTSVEGGKTLTIYHTTLVTITSCSSECVSSSTLATSAASTTAASVAASTTASSTASASATSSACAANLDGDYQYPHLIVPVNSEYPTVAYGTQYNGTINSTVSTIFNFDIPASYAGKTCSLVFLFPELADLETSSYSFNGEGGIVSHVMSTTATEKTTYDNQGTEASENGAITSLKSGNSYVISSDSCPEGKTVSFELSATNGLSLEFFEDYNPSPLGLYVRAC